MSKKLVYVELKTGYGDCGPAWIGFSSSSKSGATVYFNGLSLKTLSGSGISGNYYELESGDEYWVSGVKKNNQDRHWAGSGEIKIDKDAIDEYLKLLSLSKLPKNIESVILAPSIPNKEHHERENEVLNETQEPILGRRPIKKTINKLRE